MNIDEYRALVAQQADSKPEGTEQPDAQIDQGATPNPEQASTQTEQTEHVPADAGTNEPAPTVPDQTQTDVPQTIEINGEQVSIDELRNGYLRQSDYTQKTQQLAEQRKQLAYLEQVKQQLEANPQLAKQIAQETGLTALDPEYAVQATKEQEYWDMKLELDLQSFEAQYEDFDRKQVLETAFERQLSLEDAYLITRANQQEAPIPQVLPDLEKIKQELMEELKKELLSQQPPVDTTSIISSRGGVAPVGDTTPKLSPAEARMAKIYGMTEEEYAKWR